MLETTAYALIVINAIGIIAGVSSWSARTRVISQLRHAVELVEIDGHTYGLRPGAARVVREALADDPELDCTDFAKPAWWRGEAYGSSAAIAAMARILDGKDDGNGVANEPWQSVRTRLREAMRDAGRYRWLRDQMWSQAFTNLYAIPVAFADTADKAGEGIDAAIDAAMGEEK